MGTTAVEQLVLSESNKQIKMAEETIASSSSSYSIKSHLFAGIILNEMVHNANSYVDSGLLLAPEAEKIIHSLEHQLHILEDSDGTLEDSDERKNDEKEQSEGA